MPRSASTPLLLCVLPAERAGLAAAVRAAGGVPVVDLSAIDLSASDLGGAELPDGCWVRVRPGQAAPGNGPVILAGSGPVVAGRPTWVEVVDPRATPAGAAGIVLRGQEAGGSCGDAPGLALLAEVPADRAVILDAGLLPESAAAASGAHGVILSDVLLGLPELALPPALAERLDRADSSSSHLLNGLRIECGPLAPVLRRLLSGESFWELSRGWFSAADPSTVAWPAGLALRSARRLAETHGALTGLLAAYRQALSRGTDAAVTRAPPAAGRAREHSVAIVGLGCRLPGGPDVRSFWTMVLEGRTAIGEVPTSRWDPSLYWDADHSVPDRTYARIGAFLDDFRFDARRFRIPPRVAASIDPVQQIALESVADALEDAGLRAVAGGPGKDFDRSRCAVILGNSMGGELENDTNLRIRSPELRRTLSNLPELAGMGAADKEALLDAFEAKLKAGLPQITEDSMPGELANVIAGRVANAFDLGGANFTVDAACASSMAAVQTAIKGLLSRDFDLVLTGGVDRSMDPATYVKFSKIGALSARGSRPFDQEADGFVMGEGCGVLVLKRLADAERDGDRIYAVIRGVGASSDGKGKGITAPNPVGQVLALRRAWADAGLDPAEADLMECHGTSTVVGDKVEVECLSEVIGPDRRGALGPIRIGSVKSNIGHLKSAAGAASMIKTALAIHQGLLPPSVGFETPRTDVPFDVVPIRVQTVTEPWPSGRVRRAGVSSFGFGGTNFHVVMEQHLPLAGQAAGHRPVEVEAPLQTDHELPVGVWAASAEDREALVTLLRAGVPADRPFEAGAPIRIAAAAEDAAEQTEQARRAAELLASGKDHGLLRGRGIHVEDAPCDGRLAFLFTGQGSQYLDMGLDLAAEYPVVAQTFAEADEVLRPILGKPLTDFIRRDPSLDEDAQLARLTDTEISQPATLAVDIGILRLLAAYGLFPDIVAGHSLGEYAACVAAGIMTFEESLKAVSARGREMASIKLDDPGRMAGIGASVEAVEEVLAEVGGYVVAVNKNCPTQTVIAGESFAVEVATEAFRSRGMTVYDIPVSHAFHSRIVAPASAPLRAVLATMDIRAPRRPITTNVTSRYYPTGPGSREQILDTLAKQVAAPVEWTAQIERMYADGARIFVECGPKRALTGFVAAILKRRPHRSLYTNHPKRGGVKSIQDALSGLLGLGFPVRGRPAPGMPDLFEQMAPRRATTSAMQAWLAHRGNEPGAAEPTRGVALQVLELVAGSTGYKVADLNLGDELEADLGIDSIKQAELIAQVRDRFKLDHDPDFRARDHKSLRDLANYVARRLGSTRLESSRPLVSTPVAPPMQAPAAFVAPAPAPFAAPVVAPVAPAVAAPVPAALPVPSLPLDTTAALAALAEGAARAGMGADPSRRLAEAVLPAVLGLVSALTGALALSAPAPSRPSAPSSAAAPAPAPAPAHPTAPLPAPAPSLGDDDMPLPAIVCSGASLGLPGGAEVFAADNIARMLEGENRISRLSEGDQDRFVQKKVLRLKKDAQTGRGDFVEVSQRDEVIRLAGVKAHFDLVGDYGIDADWSRSLDETTALAFAAGIEALRDAGIPLVRTYRNTTNGKQVATGWSLPESMRDDTGVIFASAFPGYSRLVDHVQNGADDGTGHFDRRFLFQVLSMGHSQLAQLLGARGPNTQVNAACASTTQAVSIAADWIRLGRCRRVIVVGADDVTNPQLLQWIGTGFLASGAATTKDKVEEAALPFDARRHGMIIGMGAVGLVLEREDDVAARGMAPVARLLADRISNSAFHGTRLDPEHIADEMDRLVEQASLAAGVGRASMARQGLFMSHETYTPAKGGSAAAEIMSLRRAFGAEANQIVIANTKGFTGHPMGAGIEDTVAIKAIQYGRVPPLPHLQQPDPELGDLRLSRGGAFTGRYVFRLSAGFGSQLALLAWEKRANGDHRVLDTAQHTAWLAGLLGGKKGHLVVEHRTLRLIADEARGGATPPQIIEAVAAPVAAPAPSRAAPAPAPTPAPAPAPAPAPPAPAPESGGLDEAGALAELTALLAQKTGYDPSEIEPDYELEADLGIDTVKQAEVFGEVRERHGLERDESFKLSDYRTVRALASWLASQLAVSGVTAIPASILPGDPPAPPPAPPTSPPPAPGEPPAQDATDTDGQAMETLPVHAAFHDGTSAFLAEVEAATTGSQAPVDLNSALDELIVLLAAKTGYDKDDIDPDFELEADLGIDTVKQAEVFAEVRDRHGLERDDNFRLSDYRTVRALATWLSSRLNARERGHTLRQPARPTGGMDEALISQLDDPEAEASAAVVEPEPVPAPVPAAAPTPTPEPAPEPEPARPSVVRELPPTFRLRRPVAVERAPWAHGSLRGRNVEVLGDNDLAEALRDEVLSRGGRLRENGDAVIDATQDPRRAFAAARDRALSGAPAPEDWITVLRIGDAGPVLDPADVLAAGARAGIAKALSREWEGCHARVVDVDPSLDEPAVATLAVSELAAGDGAVEVRRSATSRKAFELATVPFPPAGGRLPGAPLIVLTGGTRGITARAGLALAQRGPCTLVLLARTAPGLAPLDEAAAREAAKSELKARGEKTAPARIDAAIAGLRRAEEARLNVAAMQAAGARVIVYEVDMASGHDVAATLLRIQAEHGPIAGCIHGAGVEESRPLGQKDDEAWARVYDGKALGGLALVQALAPEAWFVSMGSVAGRFGNPGQVDYAAANEAMARLCLARPRSLHLCWTAWADVGMAVRGGMETLLTSRGIELLPAEGGAELLVDMIAAGMEGELVVAGRLGALSMRSSHPLLDRLELVGDEVIAWRQLSAERDPWLLDHSIEGTPVLPGVIGLELMAAAAVATRPGSAYVGARQVQFDKAVKLHRGEPIDVVIRAEPLGDDEVSCTLSTTRTLRTGRDQVVESFRAIIRLDRPLVTEALPPVFLAETGINRGAIYKRFFHGTSFQVLRDAGAVASKSLLADAMVEHAMIAGGLLTMPLVLEAAFQAAGLHRMALKHLLALPASIEELSLVRAIGDGEPLHVMVHEQDDHYDIDVDGGGGAILRVRGFRMVDTGPLPEGDRFPTPQGGWPRTVLARATGNKVRMLSEAERASVEGRGSARRIADRLAGSEAAKLAVAALTGWPADTFSLHREESGRPFVQGPGEAPEVSITHRQGLALAAAGYGGLLGIDREQVEARPASFGSTWLTLGERALAQGEARRETAIWACKEAVLKALGTGMALDPRQIEVVELRPRLARVQLHGEAAARAIRLGGTLTVSLAHEAEAVVATALILGGRLPGGACQEGRRSA